MARAGHLASPRSLPSALSVDPHRSFPEPPQQRLAPGQRCIPSGRCLGPRPFARATLRGQPEGGEPLAEAAQSQAAKRGPRLSPVGAAAGPQGGAPSGTRRPEPALSPRTTGWTEPSARHPAPCGGLSGPQAPGAPSPHLLTSGSPAPSIGGGEKSAVRLARPPHPGGAESWVRGPPPGRGGTGRPRDTSLAKPGLRPWLRTASRGVTRR